MTTSAPELTAELPAATRLLYQGLTDPDYVFMLTRILRGVCDIPVGVYPNRGFVYDPDTKTWRAPDDIEDFGTYALSYMKAGASAVGGCCTTNADYIRQVKEARDRYVASGAVPVSYKGVLNKLDIIYRTRYIINWRDYI